MHVEDRLTPIKISATYKVDVSIAYQLISPLWR